MKTIAFFNNKGGVGKTSLVFHLAWMFSELGHRVIAADLDPQANLTSLFLSEEKIEAIWEQDPRNTIQGALAPLMEGTGDIRISPPQAIGDALWLIPGDLGLSTAEDELSLTWSQCNDGRERAFRVTAALHRIVRGMARDVGATLGLIDMGPNLGAINRATLIAADCVVMPLAPDLFSLQGLRNFGPQLRRWREEWHDRLRKAPEKLRSDLPEGAMAPIGYVISRHSIFAGGPVRSFQRWIDQVPRTYREKVLNDSRPFEAGNDEHCLARLKDYRSLIAMAQEARKPMFALRPADGAIGGHQHAVASSWDDFAALARRIAEHAGLGALQPA